MTRKPLLLTVCVVLGYGLWVSPDLKTIAAGVSIFLIGMMALEDGFKSFTGGVLEAFLRRTTDKTWKSLGFGLLVTTFMQSSSLVSVITISFISAGLIALAQGIGIIFGSNLGTTTGAWLVAGLGLKIDIAAYAMPMLVFGVVLLFQKNSRTLRGTGYILTGLGFLFLGIAYMKEGFEVFREQFDLTRFAMTGVTGLVVYTAIGIAATVVMQSSHATLILTITALAAGQVSYENALALAIGSNVGTTITAVLGALGANVAGKRLAGAHLVFNLATGILAIAFIHQFGLAVDWLSRSLGIAADNYTLKLAVFHTLFNLVGVVLMLPLIDRLVRFLERVVREKAIPPDIEAPLYLNDAALALPDTALTVLLQEVGHLGRAAFEVLAHGINLHRTDILSTASLREIVARSNVEISIDIDDLYRRRIKPIYSALLDFSARAEWQMTARQVETVSQLRVASRRVVDTIKLIKLIRPNMTRYAASDNEYIRNEYNRLRRQLAGQLRALFSIESIKEYPEIRQRLEALKVEIEQDDVVSNGTLDKLIRERLISPEMASSLMNDSAYVHEIGNALAQAAEAIYGGFLSLEQETRLEDPGVSSILAEHEAETAAMLQNERAEIDALKAK